MKEPVEFYDLKSKSKFTTSEWRLEVKEAKGRKRYFVTSILIFTAASAMCGASQTVDALIFWRIVQGLGGGPIIPGGGLPPIDPNLPLSPIPEPSTWASLLGGLAGLAGWLWAEGLPWLAVVLLAGLACLAAAARRGDRADAADRGEIPDRVVVHLREHVRIHRHFRVAAEGERVAVGRSRGHRTRRDEAVGADAVLDDELLAEHFGEVSVDACA